MKIANEFTVSAPIDQAWDVLTDLEQVIPLMPGAQLVGREGDDFLGKVKVKVGPVTSEFSGKAHFIERDATSTGRVIDARARSHAAPATRRPRSPPSCTRTGSAPASPSTPTSRSSASSPSSAAACCSRFRRSCSASSSIRWKPNSPPAPAPAGPATAGRRRAGTDSAAARPRQAARRRARAHRPARARRRRPAQEVRAQRHWRCWSVLVLIWRAAPAASDARDTPLLLRGVDLAAFAAALVARLRARGVTVSASGQAAFVQALRAAGAATRSAAVLGGPADAGQPDGGSGRLRRGVRGRCSADARCCRGAPSRRSRPAGSPQHPRPAPVSAPAADPSAGAQDDCPGPPRRRPVGRRRRPRRPTARCAAQPDRRTADEPFDHFDPADLRLIGSWLERPWRAGPRRRSMRFEPSPHGKRIDLRATMNASRTHRVGAGAPGANPPAAPAPAGRPGLRRQPLDAALRRDLSAPDAGGGAAPGADPPGGVRLLHLADPADVGAGAPLAEVALERANAKVVDRYGGTHRPQHRRPAEPRRTATRFAARS